MKKNKDYNYDKINKLSIKINNFLSKIFFVEINKDYYIGGGTNNHCSTTGTMFYGNTSVSTGNLSISYNGSYTNTNNVSLNNYNIPSNITYTTTAADTNTCVSHSFIPSSTYTYSNYTLSPTYDSNWYVENYAHSVLNNYILNIENYLNKYTNYKIYKRKNNAGMIKNLSNAIKKLEKFINEYFDTKIWTESA